MYCSAVVQKFSPHEIDDLHAIYSLLSGNIFFSFEGGGGLERFVISSVYVGLKAGLLQSFPVFYIRYTFPRLYFHLIFIL